MARKQKRGSAQDMSKTTLRLPKDLHKQLKVRAAQVERDMQDLAAEAIQQYLAQTGRVARAEK